MTKEKEHKIQVKELSIDALFTSPSTGSGVPGGIMATLDTIVEVSLDTGRFKREATDLPIINISSLEELTNSREINVEEVIRGHSSTYVLHKG